MDFLAKSKERGNVNLLQHLTHVAMLCDRFSKESGLNDDKRYVVITCGLLHDTAKCFEEFQKKLKHEDNNDTIRHNVIAWALLESSIIKINGEKCNNNHILKPLLYHHLISSDLDGITSDICNDFSKNDIDSFTFIIDNCKRIASDIFGYDLDIIFENNYGHELPHLFNKNPKNIKTSIIDNSKVLMYRSILVSADRVASKMENNNIEFTEENIRKEINIERSYDFDLNTNNIECFDFERFEKQNDFAKQSSQHRVTMMQAPSGYGKTLIALLWDKYIRNNKQLVWVTPINTIARNVYVSIKNELSFFGIDDKYKVALLIANVFEEGDETADIIVTNIDNWLRPVVKTDKEINSFNLFNCNIVFDEFHLLVQEAPFFSYYLMLLNARNNYCKFSKTLLLSATPNRLLCHYWDSDSSKTFIIKCKSQNAEQRYDIDFVNPIEINNTLYLTNSIYNSQNVYFKEHKDDDCLLHSSFTKEDYKAKTEKIRNEHGKTDNKKTNVFGTRCLSTAIDISFDNGIESVCSPEYTIQFIGRISRWKLSKDKIIKISVLNNTSDKSERGAIKKLYNLQLTKLWFNYLRDYCNGKKYITNEELYEVYNNFYSLEESPLRYQLITEFIEDKINESLNRVYDINYTTKFSNNITLSKNIIRDSKSSIYISPLDNKSNDSFINDYITYEEDKFIENDKDLITNSKYFKTIFNFIEKIEKTKDYFDKNLKFSNIQESAYGKLLKKLVIKSKNIETPLFLTTKRYNKTYGLYDNKEELRKFNI